MILEHTSMGSQIQGNDQDDQENDKEEPMDLIKPHRIYIALYLT